MLCYLDLGVAEIRPLFKSRILGCDHGDLTAGMRLRLSIRLSQMPPAARHTILK